ncbi:Os06g0548350 [Oryza sativa Japonica Group]|uniref:Os06g0548350 protein n=1 Tax=Oryza sativa subsp. japonica TaxID=39947 RepID=A0A0P0WY01_ORYSJ|nr:Os06g0548350 [Oryza sativa Japonica Group]
MQSLAVTLSSGKASAMAATRPARVPRYRDSNCAFWFCTTTRRKASLGRDGATRCHLARRSVADWFLERWTVNTVTVAGTGTSRSFQDRTIPKLPPPPPRMAQKRSSPMAALSRSLPLASTMVASRTWSEARPCFRSIRPKPPPLRNPPTPTVGPTLPGNPRREVLLAMA